MEQLAACLEHIQYIHSYNFSKLFSKFLFGILLSCWTSMRTHFLLFLLELMQVSSQNKFYASYACSNTKKCKLKISALCFLSMVPPRKLPKAPYPGFTCLKQCFPISILPCILQCVSRDVDITILDGKGIVRRTSLASFKHPARPKRSPMQL